MHHCRPFKNVAQLHRRLENLQYSSHQINRRFPKSDHDGNICISFDSCHVRLAILNDEGDPETWSIGPTSNHPMKFSEDFCADQET
jgi:hypothetical protein